MQLASYSFFKRCHLFGLFVLYAILCSACASYPVNPPLQQINEETGYRLTNRTLGAKNSDELFVVLGLSGGGTRAAALDYGVFEHLDRIQFGEDQRSLLDEVDVISSSSASSIPAAYYGLFGQQAFLDNFVDDVLYRNLETALKRKILNPLQWPRLSSGKFSRGDLAVEYFDKQIFHGHTFADMQQQRPLILINSTDIGIGAQFSFVQADFDLLCSDLSQILVARAVTASLSFTPGFTPITLKNYNDGGCGYTTPLWVTEAIAAGVEADPLVHAAARNVLSYEAIDKRPYIHLLDSGISDNMGIRVPALAFKARDFPASQIKRIEDGTIKTLVIILVDAKPKTWFKGDLKSKPPGALTSVKTSASKPLANYSYETVNLIKRNVREAREKANWSRQAKDICDLHAGDLCEQADVPETCLQRIANSCFKNFGVSNNTLPREFGIYLVHVSFELIENKTRREGFQSIPTKLELPREDVDMLIKVAPELLHENPEFNQLLRDLNATVAD